MKGTATIEVDELLRLLKLEERVKELEEKETSRSKQWFDLQVKVAGQIVRIINAVRGSDAIGQGINDIPGLAYTESIMKRIGVHPDEPLQLVEIKDNSKTYKFITLK